MPQLPMNPCCNKDHLQIFCNLVLATGGPAVLCGGVLYLGSAGGAWAAAAFMTWSGARVTTVWTRQYAGLVASAFC